MRAEASNELSKALQRARRQTLGDLLLRTRERFPNKFAIAYNEQQLTYAELDDLVNQTARAFVADGMQKEYLITKREEILSVSCPRTAWILLCLSSPLPVSAR